MTTLGTMIDRIEDELARSDLTTQIQRAILSAVAYYERRRFYFNEATGTFTTVSGQEYYGSSDLAAIPDMLMIDAMRLTIGDAYEVINSATFEEIDRRQTGTISGDPTLYTYFAEQIRLYPKPSEARTITVAYVKRFAAMSSTTDSNVWTTDAEGLIRSRAKWDLCTHITHDYEMAGFMKAAEQEELAALLSETSRRKPRRLRTDFATATTFNIYSG